MRYERLALIGTVAAFSLVAAGCTASSSPGAKASASTTGGTGSGSAVSNAARGGVVTIPMAIVGDPGNPSVGVIQTFGGPKGQFVDPPENKGNTGIYKTCSDAPAAPPPCLTVGGVGYTYGIGEFDVTVSQYVTFLNTADPRGRNTLQLYFDDMSPTAWPQYGSVRYTSGAGVGQHYSVAYPEWADKPFNFANFSRAARFANSLTNGKVLSTRRVDVARLQVRHLPGAALAGHRTGHVRPQQPGDDAGQVDGIRRPEQQRMGQGRLLRSQGRRDRLVLGVPDRPVQAAERCGAESRHRGCRQRVRSAAGDLQPERPEQHQRHSGCAARKGADLVPVAGRIELR